MIENGMNCSARAKSYRVLGRDSFKNFSFRE
jgi:hypothetical protein